MAHRNDYDRGMEILDQVAKDLGAQGRMYGDTKIVKISLVGVGMRSHAGVASTMFKALTSKASISG